MSNKASSSKASPAKSWKKIGPLTNSKYNRLRVCMKQRIAELDDWPYTVDGLRTSSWHLLGRNEKKSRKQLGPNSASGIYHKTKEHPPLLMIRSKWEKVYNLSRAKVTNHPHFHSIS